LTTKLFTYVRHISGTITNLHFNELLTSLYLGFLLSMYVSKILDRYEKSTKNPGIGNKTEENIQRQKEEADKLRNNHFAEHLCKT
ncbi:hypothetical protein Leryth_003243, partial [Lithospermum erythrorhizon]